MNVRQTGGNKTVLTQQFTDLRFILAKYLYHWPLFVLGLVIAMAGAYVYLAVVNPAFEISATILVKDEKKSPQEKSALPELEQSTSPKNAEAEIEILRSKKLVGRVVDTLHLWVDYSTKTGLKATDLYKTSPVEIVFRNRFRYQKAKSFKSLSKMVSLLRWRTWPDKNKLFCLTRL